MTTIASFSGINNVVDARHLRPGELTQAVNVDVTPAGRLSRRAGYTRVATNSLADIFETSTKVLGVSSGSLVAIDKTTHASNVIRAGVGSSRMWYCLWPDGRVAFANGSVSGVTDGTDSTAWGVPIPASIGALTQTTGTLPPGNYQYQISHVRTSDGLEGGLEYSNPIAVSQGGIVLTGLPTLAGYTTNVYLTGANGGEGYFVGSTSNSAFSFTGPPSALVNPSRNDMIYPAPIGTQPSFWRGRALVAQGDILWASIPHRWEAFDIRRDFKRFSAPITSVVPLDGGIYVGTTKELLFLQGDSFDGLVLKVAAPAPVVLGSGVEAPGEMLRVGDGPGRGRSAVFLGATSVLYGDGQGNVTRATEGRYAPAASEVSAAFRIVDGAPQYVAIVR